MAMPEQIVSGTDDRWDLLAISFERALAPAPAARAEYVASVTDGNPWLRDELTALLAASESSDVNVESLGQRLRESVLPHALTGDADAPDIGIPTRIHHYTVRELLGRGGMGAVYRAEDERLGREVALKILSTTPGSAPSVHVPLDEARALSAIDDRHVCALHSVEALPDGRLCLVMGYCAEGTLKDRLARGAVPHDEAVTLLTQTAAGLAALHARGVVHGDLKPANIGVARGGVVKLLDFGLATHSHTSAAVSPLRGTFAYLAPERLRGAPPSTASDVWALGVVAHELLTGHRPFREAAEAQTPVDAGPDESIDASVPRWLRALVAQMCAPDPRSRPADGQQVHALLLAGADAPTRTVQQPIRSHMRARLRALVPLSIAIAAGLFAIWWRALTPALAVAPSGVTPSPALPAVAIGREWRRKRRVSPRRDGRSAGACAGCHRVGARG
jgi:serine/threonine protein kinase